MRFLAADFGSLRFYVMHEVAGFSVLFVRIVPVRPRRPFSTSVECACEYACEDAWSTSCMVRTILGKIGSTGR